MMVVFHLDDRHHQLVSNHKSAINNQKSLKRIVYFLLLIFDF